MTVCFLDLYAQYLSIQKDMDAAISEVIAQSAFIGGRHVAHFEEQFATYQQASYGVGVGNGTDAIEIALEALELPQGSEILVPANSFIASSEAVTRAGHRVVFCDCDPVSYTLSLKDAESRITSQTKAIMAVHLYGHPCDMDSLMSLANKHDLRVIEDSAQAHGAEYKSRRVGTFGDVGTFSFYPGKNLGAYGDGGCIVTNDEHLAKRCRMLANHGRTGKYDHQFEGRNSRLDGLQAAILTVKLKYLDGWLERRNEVAAAYTQKLSGVNGLVLPVANEAVRHVWHLYVVRSGQRDKLKQFLSEQGIATGIHYPIALPKLEAYAYLGQAHERFFANESDSELLSLPMGEHLSDASIEKVVAAISNFFKC